MTESVPKWLLVKLPDGKMVVRCESASFRYPQDDVYVMPDGTRGMIVQTLEDDADPGYGLLRNLHGSEVSTYAEEEPEDALDALGGILRVAIAKAEATERNKWTKEKEKLLEEKKQLLEDYSATLKRDVKNLSMCANVIRELRAKNEKLRRKHKRATLWIQMLLGLLNGIDEAAVVKALVEMGAEFECAPLENPTSAPTSPATGEGNAPPNPDPKSVEMEG